MESNSGVKHSIRNKQVQCSNWFELNWELFALSVVSWKQSSKCAAEARFKCRQNGGNSIWGANSNIGAHNQCDYWTWLQWKSDFSITTQWKIVFDGAEWNKATWFLRSANGRSRNGQIVRRGIRIHAHCSALRLRFQTSKWWNSRGKWRDIQSACSIRAHWQIFGRFFVRRNLCKWAERTSCDRICFRIKVCKMFTINLLLMSNVFWSVLPVHNFNTFRIQNVV